jgi:hypothetical protein
VAATSLGATAASTIATETSSNATVTPSAAIDPTTTPMAPAPVAAEAPPAPTHAPARREVVLAFGYGAIIAPSGIVVYTAPDAAETEKAFAGISVDVTRRVEHFSLGARFWHMGATSNGYGSSAHVLTRISTQARYHPWISRTLEPWVGVELGLALAEDFATWVKTEKEAAHQTTTGVRPGFAGALEVGAQLRVGGPLAFGLRGGALYIGFEPATEKVAESAAAAKYFVVPTDYGQRIWLSIALTAELAVSD